MTRPKTRHLRSTTPPMYSRATAVCLTAGIQSLARRRFHGGGLVLLVSLRQASNTLCSSDSVFAVAWSGQHIASGGQDDTVRLWQVVPAQGPVLCCTVSACTASEPPLCSDLTAKGEDSSSLQVCRQVKHRRPPPASLDMLTR